MAYLTLLLILTVASGATPLYCSDVQSPASGSDNTDLSQVTTLQYCIIDNCTIMRIDTGQQLEIVYTTESLLIVTPIGGETSVVIAKIDNESACLEYHNTANSNQIGLFVGVFTLLSFTMLVYGYILTVHFLFKELRTLFGKLLILYSLSIFCTCGGYIVVLLMDHWITVNSQMICHTTMILFVMSYKTSELLATNVLTHLAYIMYRCYNLKSCVCKKTSKQLVKYYISYTLIPLTLVFFVVIAYDWRTGNGSYTILPNGHCSFLDYYRRILFICKALAIINKVVQITVFTVYVAYFYKFKSYIRDTRISNMQYDKELVKIAFAMGATIGLSDFIWTLGTFYLKFSNITNVIGAILIFTQQCVIMSTFLCTKKMYDLCKTRFSREDN